MRGKSRQFSIGEGSGGGGEETIWRTVLIPLLVLILAGLLAACGGATPTSYPTPTQPLVPTEVEKLGQAIAGMRGAQALQLQTLLGLDTEEFKRLQHEAPKTLAVMVLQWLGEVTEGLEPDYRPYAIEALLEEQFGIRDPRVIDPLVDAIMEDRIEMERPTPVKPTPYPALGRESIYDPEGALSVDYPTDKWQLDDSTLSHLSIPGCTLHVFAYAHGLPLEWETREYDVPVQLGDHVFLRRAWAVGSAAAPRFVGYKLDEPGRDVLFDLSGSEVLDNNLSDFTMCQEDAQAVIATLTMH